MFILSLFLFIVIANCPSIENAFVRISFIHVLSFYICFVAYKYKSFFWEAFNFEKDFFEFLNLNDLFWMYYFAWNIFFSSSSIHFVNILKILVLLTSKNPALIYAYENNSVFGFIFVPNLYELYFDTFYRYSLTSLLF